MSKHTTTPWDRATTRTIDRLSAPRRRRGFVGALNGLRLVLAGTTLGSVLFAATLTAQEDPTTAPARSEVERLRGLLERYHGDAESPAESLSEPTEERFPSETPVSRTELDARLAAPFSSRKVLLRDDELEIVISRIEARLADPALEDRRSNAPVIGAVQIRDRGALVGNSTFSFAHLGKHHYLARAALQGGRNTLTVAAEQWRIDLPEDNQQAEHVIILYAPPTADWELHALRASAVSAYPDTLPTWLSNAAEAAATP